jgi:hypothetical protein
MWITDSAIARRDDDGDEVLAHDAQHRVDEQLDRVALSDQPHRQRVHEERHVVTDDLDRAGGRLRAVPVAVEAAHPHLRLARAPAARLLPLTQDGAREPGRITITEILSGHPVQVLADELRTGPARLMTQRGPDRLEHGIDHIQLDVVGVHDHVCASPSTNRHGTPPA